MGKRKQEPDSDKEETEESTMTKEMSSKEKREKRRAERKAAMEFVPLQDEHGIAYTKQQLRRMRKRVSRGLPPLETEEEMRERQRTEALLRKEEEAELQGLIYKKEEERDSDKEEAHEDSEDDHVEPQDSIPEPASQKQSQKSQPTPPHKKARRKKPVPEDYVCQACQNKEPPAHWIYDCPMKVTHHGINKKSSKVHIIEPSDRKVFVSGLPFETKVKDVRQMFAGCGEIKHCKLLTFNDSDRCKGQCYITFETVDSALMALKQNGTSVERSSETDGHHNTSRKTLTLRVSKVKNRLQTQRKRV